MLAWVAMMPAIHASLIPTCVYSGSCVKVQGGGGVAGQGGVGIQLSQWLCSLIQPMSVHTHGLVLSRPQDQLAFKTEKGVFV